MPLALFDLDNTLLAGDSDHAWGQFIVARGLADADTYGTQNERFYRDYACGRLDAVAYQRFCLAPLAGRSVAEIARLHREFMAEFIAPMRLPQADDLLAHHRQQGDRLLVITATNRCVAGPIVAGMGIAELLCTEPQIENDRYTGGLIGEPCMGEGKVRKLKSWLRTAGETLDGATFYSDSHNDLPLLNTVPRPCAVDPDDRLREVATQRGWPIISLR
ncbi:MAG: HAD family hydrolase [Cellvibrionales bacterium]|nr:HAD family hydrolase [Cellvibrionales bacterium]